MVNRIGLQGAVLSSVSETQIRTRSGNAMIYFRELRNAIKRKYG